MFTFFAHIHPGTLSYTMDMFYLGKVLKLSTGNVIFATNTEKINADITDIYLNHLTRKM
jgi:hypothetical protein